MSFGSFGHGRDFLQPIPLIEEQNNRFRLILYVEKATDFIFDRGSICGYEECCQDLADI